MPRQAPRSLPSSLLATSARFPASLPRRTHRQKPAPYSFGHPSLTPFNGALNIRVKSGKPDITRKDDFPEKRARPARFTKKDSKTFFARTRPKSSEPPCLRVSVVKIFAIRRLHYE